MPAFDNRRLDYWAQDSDADMSSGSVSNPQWSSHLVMEPNFIAIDSRVLASINNTSEQDALGQQYSRRYNSRIKTDLHRSTAFSGPFSSSHQRFLDMDPAEPKVPSIFDHKLGLVINHERQDVNDESFSSSLLAQVYPVIGQGVFTLTDLIHSGYMQYPSQGYGFHYPTDVQTSSFLMFKNGNELMALDLVFPKESEMPSALLCQHLRVEEGDGRVHIYHRLTTHCSETWADAQREGLLLGEPSERILAVDLEKIEAFAQDFSSPDACHSALQAFLAPLKEEGFEFSKQKINHVKPYEQALRDYANGDFTHMASWAAIESDAGKLLWPNGNMRNEFIDKGHSWCVFRMPCYKHAEAFSLFVAQLRSRVATEANASKIKSLVDSGRLTEANAAKIKSLVDSGILTADSSSAEDLFYLALLNNLSMDLIHEHRVLISSYFRCNLSAKMVVSCLQGSNNSSAKISHDWGGIVEYYAKPKGSHDKRMTHYVKAAVKQNFGVAVEHMLLKLSNLDQADLETHKRKVARAIERILDEYQLINETKRELPSSNTLTYLATILEKIDVGAGDAARLSSAVEAYRSAHEASLWSQIGELLTRLKFRLVAIIMDVSDVRAQHRSDVFNVLGRAIGACQSVQGRSRSSSISLTPPRSRTSPNASSVGPGVFGPAPDGPTEQAPDGPTGQAHSRGMVTVNA